MSSRFKTTSWIQKGQWRLGEKIGSGSFGEVFQGMSDDGFLFAVKRLHIVNHKEIVNLTSEIELMQSLSHENIVKYLGAKVDEELGVVYIFQEWVDIKGGNILVDDSGNVKLADFGASTTLSSFGETQETATIKGTPYFMAPEVLSASKYGRRGDVWAVGCTMVQMLTGDPPWKDRKLQTLIQLHMLLSTWEGIPPIDREIPDDLRDFLDLCFQKDSRTRPMPTVLLQHPFLRD
ncbi:mkkA, partial [Symbiodinium microadriaticum]